MPQKNRKESSTGVYHVIVKGIAHERIFYQTREKNKFIKIILKYSEKYAVKIYAYCIMSNHTHLMIWAEISVLSLFMARILAEYAYYYNYKHNRNGHVFQNRFTSECIETEIYLWNCLRYIHMNPVKAGIVSDPLSYRFSSIGEFFSDKEALIHQEIKKMVKIRYECSEQFYAFHKRRKKEVFQDIAEEMERQRFEIAGLIAEEMVRKFGVDYPIQIFEEKDYREEYIRNIQQTLKVSKRKSTLLYEKMRNHKKNN